MHSYFVYWSGVNHASDNTLESLSSFGIKRESDAESIVTVLFGAVGACTAL